MCSAREIAASFRLRRSRAGEWRGTCPACGYEDSFILTKTPDRVLGWCASCQDNRAIAALLRSDKPVSGSRIWRPAARKNGSAKTDLALALWNRAEPPGEQVEAYLRSRGAVLPKGAPLRFLADCPHPSGCRLPAMIALVTTAVGEPVAIHRTYLRPDDFGKAAIEPQKATLGPAHGNAVVLHQPGPEVVVGEGLETTLAAAEIFGLPGIAALTAGSLATCNWLPAGVERVLIAADHDLSGTGQNAATAAGRRLTERGVTVRIALPEATETDFADILLARQAKGAAHAG